MITTLLFTVVTVVISLLTAVLYGRKTGASYERHRTARKHAEVKQKQLDNVVNAPRSTDALVDKLRNGGTL